MDADGWEYYYDDSTFYVGRRHPKGGKGSICSMSRVMHVTDRKRVGEAIAKMLNDNPELIEAGVHSVI